MVRRKKNYVEFIYCVCGCQKTRPKYDKKYRQRYFITGHMNKGKHFTQEWKDRISKSHKGDKNPMFGKVRELNPGFGKSFSKEHRIKLSQAHKDKRLSEEHKKKLSMKLKGKNSSEKHYLWKGDQVKYNSLHTWIRKYLQRPDLCQMCNKNEPKEVANITGTYNREFKNWKWYCHKCHKLFDNIIERNLKPYYFKKRNI